MNGIPEGPDPAKGRYVVMQMLRLSGVAMVLISLLAINRKIELPELAGYVLLVVGLLDVFLMPALLAKRWKTPHP